MAETWQITSVFIIIARSGRQINCLNGVCLFVARIGDYCCFFLSASSHREKVLQQLALGAACNAPSFIQIAAPLASPHIVVTPWGHNRLIILYGCDRRRLYGCDRRR